MATRKQPGAPERQRRTRQSIAAKAPPKQTTAGEPFDPDRDLEITSPSALRQRALGETVRCPSGLVCRAKRVGMDVLIAQGSIPNSLLPIVKRALEDGRGSKDVDASEVLRGITQDQLGDMMRTMDEVVLAVVTAPRLLPVPEYCVSCGRLASDHPEDHEGVKWSPVPDRKRPTHVREEEVGYIDWIEPEDKYFLWQFAVGGTRDIERFRQQQGEFVDDLSAR
jgi:hypothetical protein